MSASILPRATSVSWLAFLDGPLCDGRQGGGGGMDTVKVIFGFISYKKRGTALRALSTRDTVEVMQRQLIESYLVGGHGAGSFLLQQSCALVPGTTALPPPHCKLLRYKTRRIGTSLRPVRCREDRSTVLKTVEHSGHRALAHADPALKKDRELVLAAVKQDGYALGFADDTLRGTREIVMAAVKKDGPALKFADPELQNDRELVLTAIDQDGRALQHADPRLKKDRDIVIRAVAQTWRAITYAAPKLQKDDLEIFEVVKAGAVTAMEQYGLALRGADPELKKDRDIVLAAVKQSAYALMFADPELKKDREIVLAAVKQHSWALRWADPELRNDREFLRLAGLEA